MERELFLKKYLDRIGIDGQLNPDLETLKKIQKQHLINIPFENIDIFINRSLELNTDSLFNKIVKEKRGGICYELNGLFLKLLREIGYDVKYISGRIREEGTYLDHILLLVNMDKEKYIVDVGFKDNYLYPIKMVPNLIQENYRNTYKINKLDNDKYQLIKIVDNTETILYTFTTEEKKLSDFEMRCKDFETTPNTYFTNNPFSAIEREDGKVFITDKKLTITKDAEVDAKDIKNKEEFYFYLEKFFKIKLPVEIEGFSCLANS